MAALAAGVLAGCETTSSPDEAPGDEAAAAQGDPIGDLIASIPEAPRLANISAQGFIGKPVAALEAETGAPALTRAEGENEFRRYDLGACRLYAVVIPAGGNVSSLSVSPAVMGSVMPSFAECLAARRTTGS